MNETWRPVVGYEGYYEVSDLGRVKRVGHAKGAVVGRVLRPKRKRSGHLFVSLCSDAQPQYHHIHRLVLAAFVGPCPDGMEGCHNDGDPAHNALSNLRWDTRKSNARDTLIHGRNVCANRTHCPRNHLLDHPNLVASEWRKGGRSCLACARASTYIWHRGGDLQELSDAYYAAIMAGASRTEEAAARL